jgi:hypothetical protein
MLLTSTERVMAGAAGDLPDTVGGFSELDTAGVPRDDTTVEIMLDPHAGVAWVLIAAR